MTTNVQMVFQGEVLDGFPVGEVKRRLAQALKLGDERLAQLFSGERTVLKDSIEADVARRYVEQLALLGARVHLEPVDESADATPLPQLPDVPTSDEPPPPPWGTPPRPSRPAPLSPLLPPSAPSPIAPARSALDSAPQVTCPKCGERQSKRLLCRACATNIEMAFAARDDAAAQARAQRQDAMKARRGHRGARVAAGNDGAGVFGLSFDGRMGRLKYATANLVMLALIYIPLILALQRPTLGRIALLGVAALLLSALGMRLAVLRCHDCDKSGWWSMLLWLPTVNVIVTIVLACAPGTDGSNEYGEQPPPSSGAAFGIAALCALLLFGLTFSHMMKGLEQISDVDGQDDGVVPFQSDPRAVNLVNVDSQWAPDQ
jgi:uncharacterized membrane protein YhaH (DUF805 family)